MDLIIIIGIVIYFIIAVLLYGILFNYWQKLCPSIAKEDYAYDLKISIIFAFIGFPSIWILLYFHYIDNIRIGFKFK